MDVTANRKAHAVAQMAKEAFETGMEILQLVELMERQNTGRINGNISDSGAARAGITIRNSMITRLVILVARAFPPTRSGDKHLRKGFEELNDATVRGELAMDKTAFADAERMWQALQVDPRLTTIKHFRDKYTAHSANPTEGVAPPNFGDMFAFARAVSAVMEKFAIGVGVTTERLSDTEDWRVESSQKFWEPWEFYRKGF
jgi:AbiU2